MQVPASPPSVAGDGSLGLKQFGLAALGTAATVGAGLSLTLLFDDQEDQAFGASIIVAPTVAGLVVCGVGRWSVLYTGRCGAAVAGAYLGALGGTLTGLLLGFAACSSGTTNSSNRDSGPAGGDCETTPLVGALVGYVLGTTTGALVGWNLSKQPKSAPLTDVNSAELDVTSDGEQYPAQIQQVAPVAIARGADRSRHQVIFPLFAAAF